MFRNDSTKIFVEATPLLDDRLSGIGHTLLSLLEVMTADSRASVTIILVSPFDKIQKLRDRTNHLQVEYKSIPLPSRVLYGLMKFNLVPPLDLYLGKGVYIFPNFRNWRLLRSKSITYIYDLAFRIFPEYTAPKNQRFLTRNMQHWINQTDMIVTVSQHTKRDLEELYHVPSEAVAVITCGVDIEQFYRRSQSEIDAVKKRYAIHQNYCIFLSTVEPRKNVDTLLAAYDEMPAPIRDDMALVLIGSSGWLNQGTVANIEALRKKGRTIIWPQTYVPDVDLPALLSGAEMLIHPAFYEGFGIGPLQAMACKTPVIVANNSSLPEVVGATGLYFEASDHKALCSRMVEVAKHSPHVKKLASSGYKRAQGFTWGRSGQRLLNLALSLDGDK